MSNTPLVSVVVPTFNSEAHLEVCLESVNKQSYPNIEIIIVDSCSQDKTADIARKHGKVTFYPGGLLGARYIGATQASGEYVVLLDSDQILEQTTIERSVELMDEFDMLCFEEKSYEPSTFTAKLFEADRELIHKCANLHLDPIGGAMLARFYKKQILDEAFKRIPKNIFPVVIAHDHAIIYYEAYSLSSKVGILRNAVWHIEPSSLLKLCRKNFRYGRSTKELSKSGVYGDLLHKKCTFRKGVLSVSNLRIGAKSCFLLSVKAVAYEIGLLI